MELVEPEESFRFGHHVDTTQVGLEVYRLATMFLSSEQIADFSLEGQRTGKGMVDYDTHWLEELSLKFFWGETSRILVYTTIQGRLLRSIPHCKSLSIWDEACGDIETGMIVAPESFGAGPLSGSVKPLTLKQAFDKIIHFLAINPDVEPLTEFGSFGPTKTNPILFLYGKHWNEKAWRATLSVLEYVRLMRRILVAVGAQPPHRHVASGTPPMTNVTAVAQTICVNTARSLACAGAGRGWRGGRWRGPVT